MLFTVALVWNLWRKVEVFLGKFLAIFQTSPI